MSAAEAPDDRDERDERDELEPAEQVASGKSDEALDEQLAGMLTYALPGGTLLLAIGAGVVFGAGMAILVLAAGTLVGGIAAFWQSVRTLAGETPLTGADAYAIGAPRAEEEQKRAVLRALKDLEFERGVGKISEDDYGVLVIKYRAEAKRLLRLLDEEAAPRRQQVEALIAKRLRREGLASASPTELADVDPAGSTTSKARDDADDAKGKKRKRRGKDDGTGPAPIASTSPTAPTPPTARACPSCATMNDLDAVFCKKCAARMVAADAGAEDDGGAS